MRRDLNMRKGKMVAQGGHAVALSLMRADRRVLSAWLETGMKKICVGVDDEKGLRELVELARTIGVPAQLVVDAGHTEFHGVPTATCAAIGPAPSDAVDRITGKLVLL